jgi:hypothetical protein
MSSARLFTYCAAQDIVSSQKRQDIFRAYQEGGRIFQTA